MVIDRLLERCLMDEKLFVRSLLVSLDTVDAFSLSLSVLLGSSLGSIIFNLVSGFGVLALEGIWCAVFGALENIELFNLGYFLVLEVIFVRLMEN